ncbi:MAG: WhiB family transcriptional regulator [Egibacteraceae bacterium]
MEIEDWRLDAACADTDRDLFYSEEVHDMRAALNICAACPVVAPCLETAMRYRDRFGVWGGTTETERRRIFRQRRGDGRQAA